MKQSLILKIWIVLIGAFICTACEEDWKPEKVNLTATTGSATSITASSVKVGISSSTEKLRKKGVLLSTKSGIKLTDSGVYKFENTDTYYSIYEITITGLDPNTTYYYRAYVADYYGAVIYGAEKSFTTLKKVSVTATTDLVKQTGSDYSSSGFYSNGYYYNYKFHFETNFSYTGTADCTEIGFILDGSSYTFNNMEDRSYTNYWTQHNNLSSSTLTYQAYAEKKDGTIVYGIERTIYLYYGRVDAPPLRNSQGEHTDFDVVGLHQRKHASFEGGASGQNIIHQEHVLPLE